MSCIFVLQFQGMHLKKNYTYTFKVDKNSIDGLDHVNNVVYLDWAQIVAEKHWNQLSEKLINNNYVWVVKRHEIDYFFPVFLNDEITLNTYIGESYGVKSERYVNIIKDEKIVCSVKTIWCLLDKFTMKPVRIPIEISSLLDSNKLT